MDPVITYDKLISTIPIKVKLVVKDKYSMIIIPKSKYHITIFRDQWDEYKSTTNLNYHLFHITSNSADIKCSTYFFVDSNTNRIKKIPNKYFKYEQESYGFSASTRSPCEYKSIKRELNYFQKILDYVQKKLN